MATSLRKKRAIITIAVSAALVLSGGSAAFAYWTSTGSGTGNGTTGTSTAFTISTVAPVTGLTPGGAAQTVTFVVKNPGTATEKLSGVTAAIAGPAGAAATFPTGCSIADYVLGTPVITVGNIAGGGTISGTVDITMVNDLANNQDGCQTAVVPLYFVSN